MASIVYQLVLVLCGVSRAWAIRAAELVTLDDAIGVAAPAETFPETFPEDPDVDIDKLFADFNDGDDETDLRSTGSRSSMELLRHQGQKLLRSGGYCSCPYKYLASVEHVYECTKVVKAVGGKFFALGTGLLSSGNCYVKYPSAVDCPEGMEDAEFDYYDIPSVSVSDALHNHVSIIQATLTDGSGGVTASGLMLQRKYSERSQLVAERHGEAGWFTKKFCRRVYKLEVKGGFPYVQKYRGCCKSSGEPCTLAESDLEKDTAVELEHRGDSWEVCSKKQDSFWFGSPAADPELPSGTLHESCLKLEVKSTIITLREALKDCAGWKKSLIKLVSSTFHGQYKRHYNQQPGSERGSVVSWLLDKGENTSVMDPIIFDKYAAGMVAVLVHMTMRQATGFTLPAKERISLPTKKDFLDRHVVFDFMGLPAKEIDKWDALSTEGISSCVVDAMRTMRFNDGIENGENVWERVYDEVSTKRRPLCPIGLLNCTKKEYIYGLFHNYTTQDGLPVYPVERVNFADLWHTGGRWVDELEKFLAWHHWGSHDLQALPEHSPYTLDGAKFMFKTSELAALSVRDGFARVGADMFFNGAGEPVMVRTTEGKAIWRSKAEPAEWQYWKFVWRSSAFLKVTLIDHLWATHFTAANSLSAASREALPAAHPFRRLLTMFTYGTIAVNADALHQLLGPDALLNRATPFLDFQEVSRSTKTLVPSMTDRFGAFVDPERREAMPKEIRETPFMQDGQLLYDNLREWIGEWFAAYGDLWCKDGVLVDPDLILFFKRAKEWSMYQQHADTDEPFFGLYTSEGSLNCSGIEPWLSTLFFQVTGYHRHVGSVADTAADPDLAAFSWVDQEPYSRPRQALHLALIAASTATSWPKMSEDYTHLAKGIERQEKAEGLFRSLHERMQSIGKEIDNRNKARGSKFEYWQMHPNEVECSVAV